MEKLISGKEDFLGASPESQIQQLRKFVTANFRRLTTHQRDNGLITASLGRYDDHHFRDMLWIKDAVRASKWALDPIVQSQLPELFDPEQVKAGQFSKTGTDFYLSTMRGLFRLQTSPQQWERFNNKPSVEPDEHGYFSIDDRDAPAIKFHLSGNIQTDWGHNQPDNWGTLLLEVGKGIEAGLPLLEKAHPDDIPPALVIDHITKYLVNLKTERLNCRSLWEHDKGWSSYSTRRIVQAGLEQIARVQNVIQDSILYYEEKPETHSGELEEAIGRLKNSALEYFPADYTDSSKHLSKGDLASLVVLNDISDLSSYEIRGIIRNTRALMTPNGYIRYEGDPWQNENELGEASWTMGLLIDAKFASQQAERLFLKGRPKAQPYLEFGLDRIGTFMAFFSRFGWSPELFKIKYDETTGKIIPVPNNNHLAWPDGYGIEAAPYCMSAIKAEKTYSVKTSTSAVLVS